MSYFICVNRHGGIIPQSNIQLSAILVPRARTEVTLIRPNPSIALAVAIAEINTRCSVAKDSSSGNNDGVYVVISGRISHRRRLAHELDLGADEYDDAHLVRMAYNKWGVEWIEHNQGYLAAVVIDVRRGFVIASRDEMGREPLFYALTTTSLLLANRPQILLRHPCVSTELDSKWLAWYFNADRSSEVGELSPFLAIRNLLPNHSLICRLGEDIDHHKHRSRLGLKFIRYSHVSDYADDFLDRLKASIADQTSGIDRLAIMLSGGMDSCPVGCLAARSFQQTGQSLIAISWTLEDFPKSDESRELTLCADFAGIPLVKFEADPFLPFNDISNWPFDVNGPYGNCYWPLFEQIDKRAALYGCHALLRGNFGDQLYPKGWELADALKDGEWRLAYDELRYTVGAIGWSGLMRSSKLRNVAKRWWPYHRSPRRIRPVWLKPDSFQLLDYKLQPNQGIFHSRPDHYRSLLNPDIFYQYIGYRYVDKSYDIKAIDPFDDWDLIDFMLGIPAYQTHLFGQSKIVARNAMRGIMPESLRTRPRGGILHSFFDQGYECSRNMIKSFLFDAQSTWENFVEVDFITRALSDVEVSGLHKAVVAKTIGYEVWSRGIRLKRGLAS